MSDIAYPEPIIIGVKFGTIADLEAIRQIVKENISPPKIMTKAETIEAWWKNDAPRLIDQLANRLAYENKTFATIESAYMIAPKQNAVFDSQHYSYGEDPEDDYLSVEHAMFAWLMPLLSQLSGWANRTFHADFAFYGIDAPAAIRTWGLACGRLRLPLPLGVWYGANHVHDAFHMLVEKEHRDLLSPALLLQLHNIDTTVTKELQAENPAKAEAILSLELLSHFGLITLPSPTAVESGQSKPSKKTKKSKSV